MSIMGTLSKRRTKLAGLAAALPLFAALAGALPAYAQEMVVVPNRVIYPGQTVTADALEEVELRRQLRGGTSVVRSPDEIEGLVAKRTLLPGRMIMTSAVRKPHLVETGSAVTVLFSQGALQISLMAVPLQPGAAGDVIKLRNIDSGAVFSGIVMQDGSVRVLAS